MQVKLSNYFRDIIKILGVSIAVYLALIIKIEFIGEENEINQIDYLGQEEGYYNENDMVDNQQNNSESEVDDEHGTNSVFSKLCKTYSVICKKIKRSGTFNDQEKAIYLAYVSYLLKYLDANTKHGNTPSEALLAMLINDKQGSRRGSANRDTITINMGGISYDNEFFQIISHEMGHIIDLGGLQGVSSKKSSNFTEFNKEVFSVDDPSIEYYKYSRLSEKNRKDGMTKEDFCSGYGMSDPFEDFAECNNLFLNHHDYFRKIALNNDTVKKKYNYFSNLYGGQYINDSEAKYENRDDSFRARDTTKLIEG